MKNRFFVYSESSVRESKFYEIISSFRLCLTPLQWERLTGVKNVYSEMYGAIIEVESEELCASVEEGKYLADCSPVMIGILSCKEVHGSSSLYLNKVALSILPSNISNGMKICKLNAEDGFETLTDFFSSLNESDIPYVVLRKYETLPYGYLEGDHDIDILCESLEDTVRVLNAKHRNLGISAFSVKIQDIDVDVDIRFTGDNYIDTSWEIDILASSMINKNGVRVMSKENQLFTLLYHNITQKTIMSNYYIETINSLIAEIFPYNTEYKKYEQYLIAFMKRHKYCCKKPLDESVIQVRSTINIINKKTRIFSRLKMILIHLYRLIPDRNHRLHGSKLYNYIDDLE